MTALVIFGLRGPFSLLATPNSWLRQLPGSCRVPYDVLPRHDTLPPPIPMKRVSLGVIALALAFLLLLNVRLHRPRGPGTVQAQLRYLEGALARLVRAPDRSVNCGRRRATSACAASAIRHV